MLEKASEKPSRFSAKDWMEISNGNWKNHDSYLIEIKTSMLQSRFLDYIFACILVKARLTAIDTGIVMCN